MEFCFIQLKRSIGDGEVGIFSHLSEDITIYEMYENKVGSATAVMMVMVMVMVMMMIMIMMMMMMMMMMMTYDYSISSTFTSCTPKNWHMSW